MNDITLKNQTSSTVKTDTYELEVNGKKIIYIEYLNDKNKVIDCSLRDENGDELPIYEGAASLEKIQEYIDNLPAIK